MSRNSKTIHVTADDDPLLVAWAEWVDAQAAQIDEQVRRKKGATKQAEHKFVVLCGLLALGFDGHGYRNADNFQDAVVRISAEREPEGGQIAALWGELERVFDILEQQQTVAPEDDNRDVWRAIREIQRSIERLQRGAPVTAAEEPGETDEALAREREANLQKQFKVW